MFLFNIGEDKIKEEIVCNEKEYHYCLKKIERNAYCMCPQHF